MEILLEPSNVDTLESSALFGTVLLHPTAIAMLRTKTQAFKCEIWVLIYFFPGFDLERLSLGIVTMVHLAGFSLVSSASSFSCKDRCLRPGFRLTACVACV